MFIFLFFLCLLVTTNASNLLFCYHTPNKPFGFAYLATPSQLCTHLSMIGSTHIDGDGSLVKPSVEELTNFAAIRHYNRNLNLLLCVTSANPTFTKMTSSYPLMKKFAEDVVETLLLYKLDGLDIDWEFPVWSQDGSPKDRGQFGLLLKVLHKEFKKHRFILAVAVSGPPTISRIGYDVDALQKYADLVQIMNYDFHVYSRMNPLVGYNAPLRALEDEPPLLNEMNSESSMSTWFSLGLSPNKTLFGIPLYARGYKLLLSSLHTPYSPSTGATDLVTDYSEVCLFSNHEQFHKVWSENAGSPYMYFGKLWISYENEKSIRLKTIYAKSLGCAGVMVYSIGNDDYKGQCGGSTYPLLNEVHKTLRG